MIEISYVHIGKHSAAVIYLEPHMKSLKTLALAIATTALFAGSAMAAAPKAQVQECPGESLGGVVKDVKKVGNKTVMSFLGTDFAIRIPTKDEAAKASALMKVKPGTLYCEEPAY